MPGMGVTALRNVRVDEDLWSAAMARAASEGTHVSGLIRQWLEDYVAAGQVGVQPKVRITAGERDAARRALARTLPDVDVLIADVVNAINAARESICASVPVSSAANGLAADGANNPEDRADNQ